MLPIYYIFRRQICRLHFNLLVFRVCIKTTLIP